jgi:hypothetical protein
MVQVAAREWQYRPRYGAGGIMAVARGKTEWQWQKAAVAGGSGGMVVWQGWQSTQQSEVRRMVAVAAREWQY